MGCSRGDNLRETYQEGLPELLFVSFMILCSFLVVFWSSLIPSWYSKAE